MLNTSHIKIARGVAIANSGAKGHFLLPGTQVKKLKPRDKPLTTNLPVGTQLQSTHTCDINVPWLPNAARIALIVPIMVHTFLVSIKVLTDAGFKVVYDKDDCRVYFNRNIVWAGGK